MDLERSRIKADLGGLIKGDVRCDELSLQLYSSDASIYQIRPLVVVRPVGTEDVVACVKYAGENHLSLHARGSGSSVNGAPLGPGIVLDFTAAMRRVLERSPESIRVQPGVILASLNRQLQASERLFGPDPALRSVKSLGGVIATNASGSHWLKYGAPRDKVLSLQVVTAAGEVVELHRGEVGPPESIAAKLQSTVSEVLTRRRELIKSHRPDTRVNGAGYQLDELAPGGSAELTRLLAGSEGTLGIITQAELQLDVLPKFRGVALLFFSRLEAAVTTGLEIVQGDVVACDLMDRRLLSLAREIDPRLGRLIPSEAEAMLLVEQEAESKDSLVGKLNQLIFRYQKRKKVTFQTRFTTEKQERNFYWRLTRRVTPSLYRLRGRRQAIPFVDEMAVAPARLPQFLAQAHSILNEFEVTASIFGHIAQGVVHLHPFLDLANENDRAKMEPLARRLFEQVVELNGTISGSLGDGLSRTWFLRHQYGKAYEVFKEIKRIFDPQNLLNPGKIIDEPSANLTDSIRALQPSKHWLNRDEELPTTTEAVTAENGKESAKQLKVITPQLNWSPNEIADAAANCNGCGRCRTTGTEERMCPIFRLAPVEEASPRAKANLVRGLISGDLAPQTMSQEALKEVADLCVNCHQCRLECPATVDIPKLMVETKAQYVAINGLKFSQWLLTRLDLLYWFGGRLPWITNLIASNRSARWLIDRIFGLSQGRKLPKFSSRSLVRWAARHGLNRPSRQGDRRVLYFVDAFANWNDVELGKALVRVLQHNGISVFVPGNQYFSGMSLICDGLVERARILAHRNVEMLAEYVRQGYHVVTTEPSAALALKHEYLHLLDDEDAQLVSENTSDACNYLWKMHAVGQLELDFKPLNSVIGYHLPCHQRALGNDIPGLRLLDLIPGLTVDHLERGCSGMAGIYGMKRQNYRRSLRAGVGLMSALRRADIIVGSTECSTCKIQMEHGTTKTTVHPIKILALAYRLMPELENLFKRRSGVLTIS